MPVAPTYPGVYVEEISSGVRTIVGVATSITAFIGRAARGPTDMAITINSFGDFERIFGGLWEDSFLGFVVRDFYLNGGSQAVIVRLNQPEVPEEDSRAVQQAALAVATAAKEGPTVADAKTKATGKNSEIQADANMTAMQKAAAQAVLDAIKNVPDDGTMEEIAEAADSAVAEATPPFPNAQLTAGSAMLAAAYPGTWGANLRAIVDGDVSQDVAARMGLEKADLFNLTVRDASPGGGTERFLNVSYKDSPRRIDHVLEAESRLVRWDSASPLDGENAPADPSELAEAKGAVTTAQGELDAANAANPQVPADIEAAKEKLKNARKNLAKAVVDPITAAEMDLADAKQEHGPNSPEAQQAMEALQKAIQKARDAVSDGTDLTKATNFTPGNAQNDKKGLYALEQLFARDGLFNLLCIPPYQDDDGDGNYDVEPDLISEAVAYCEKRRAMLIVDPPSGWKDKTDARNKFTDPNSSIPRNRNAALFFPRFKLPNPLHDNQMEDFAPCGAVAGIFARTDTQRGVWKAPAGLDATLVGVPQLSVPLTDEENGELNPLGINCLRAFPNAGRVVWGSRTLRGADQLADEYKYIPVRRLALYIEESLFRGLKWVVFEPNDEPLWAQVRLNVGAFMHNLFRQGAFQGSTPRDAYFVKCDKETTTQNDINLGIVNIVVGFAPLKPAEFVIIKLQQMAGQIQV
jgi:uncharacterized protein